MEVVWRNMSALLMALITVMAAESEAFAGEPDRGMDAIMKFLGADTPEDMDSDDVEHLSDLLDKPLAINSASMASLVESGLFTRYQAASICDYRQSSGGILSLAELSAVDGIGEDFARRVAPFVSLDGSLANLKARRYSGEVRMRAAIKPSSDGDMPWSIGVRYSSKAGETLSAGLAYSKTYSRPPMLQDIAGHLSWNPGRVPVSLIAGEFNARFGQGLALWTGMGMSGVSSVGSMERRPSGFSPSASMSARYSLTGLAASYSARRLVVSAGLALPGIREAGNNGGAFGMMPVADISWFAASGQVSLTAYSEIHPRRAASGEASVGSAKTSISQRWSIRGAVVFSEVSYDWISRVPAALAGVSFKPFDGLRMGAMLRYYPREYASDYSSAVRSLTKCSNEHSVSVAADFALGKYMQISGSEGFGSSCKRHTGSFAADFAFLPEPKSKDETHSRQFRLVSGWQMIADSFWSVRLRFCEKLRTWGKRSRTEIRAETVFRMDGWSAGMRLDAVMCDKYGLLGYMEGGWKGGGVTAWLRAGVFFADDWDDRIYVYERDAPGTFNVPAFYGRGFWVSMTASWKYTRWGRIYIRAGCTSYPFMQTKRKPGRAELKVQLDFRF